jgi:hypothetical protein
MLEKLAKTVITAMALGVLFWAFWNPVPKKAKANASKDKTELTANKNKAKKARARKKGKARNAQRKAKDNKVARTGLPEPAEGSAYVVVTGSIRTVRFRDKGGKIYGPGDIAPGRYDILSRRKGKVIEHGQVALNEGERKRIDCDDDGCKVWKPKSK